MPHDIQRMKPVTESRILLLPLYFLASLTRSLSSLLSVPVPSMQSPPSQKVKNCAFLQSEQNSKLHPVAYFNLLHSSNLSC